MRILMFGWEFPPHITGGLGTACLGLTKALSSQQDIEILFVVPKAYGDEDRNAANILGANTIQITKEKIVEFESGNTIRYLEVSSNIVPYVDPEDYYKMVDYKVSTKYKTIQTNSEGCIDFTGNYGPKLMTEIKQYALVAETIAQTYPFDVIHAHDWLTYPAGMAAKQISHKPLIVHVHATEFDRSGGHVNPEVFLIEQEGMLQADHVITVSKRTQQTVRDKYKIDAEKISTVYNAVENPQKERSFHFRKNTDEKLVTYMGRITMQKGPEYFIKAAQRVLEKESNVRFVMAGSGDLMYKMVELAAGLNIAHRFHFTGFLSDDEVPALLQMSDVYVLPSVSEPFGIVPLEAMQANVPVIISKQTGVAEILTHAVKVDYWDIDAMADAIYGLIKYPALRRMFQRNGKAEVAQLKWKNSAKALCKIYHHMLEKDQSS